MNHVLLATWQQRRNQGSLWMLGSVVALVAAIPLVMAALGKREGAQATAVVAALTLAAGAWATLVLGVLQQNHPVVARTVPGHVVSLRRALGLAWVVLAALAAGGAQLVFGAGAVQAAWGFGLALVAIALMMRWPASWQLLWLLPATAGLWSRWPVVHQAKVALQQALQQQPLMAMLLLVAAAFLSLMVVVQTGGAAHERHYKRQQCLTQALGGRQKWFETGGMRGVPRWLLGVVTWPYRRLLQRWSLRPEAAMDRAMLALGPGPHWSGQLGSSVVVLGIMALVLLLLQVLVPHWRTEAQSSAVWGFACGLLSFGLNPLLQLRNAYHTTRTEQALMRLCPGVPGGVALNKAIALRHAGHVLAAWALSLLAAMALAAALVGPQAIDIPLALALGLLPMGTMAWRDWARAKAPGPSHLVVTALAMLLLGGVASLALHLGVPLALIAAVSLALTLASGAWRWRRLVAALPSWPAERAG